MMNRLLRVGHWRMVWPALLFACHASLNAMAEQRSTPQLRRPIALVVQGERLWVANRRSGSLSIIGLSTRKVTEEYSVGEQLEDVVTIPGTTYLLAADSGADRLLLIDSRTGQVVEYLTLPADPVQVRVARDGTFCTVTSLWAHQVCLVDIVPPELDGKVPKLRLREKVDLPFAPRQQWLARDGSPLVVADAFGGRLAVIDPHSARLLAIRTLDGHNISGIAADADERELLISHQILNEAVPTTRDRVFWGTVMSNVVRSIPLVDLTMDAGNRPLGHESQVFDLARWSLHPLGRPGAATGDPSAVAVTQDGKTVIALAGVNEVAYRSAPLQPFYQRPVGRRPIAVAFDEQERFAFIANHFDDSVSVLDLESEEVVETISLGPQPELTNADRGEILFYDARFSLDGWYSCHSCHTEGHSNGLLNDNLSDDGFGAPKRVLSLLGVGDTGPWTWSGQQDSLQRQAHKSITITMRDHEEMHATDENTSALAAYMRTLKPPPSILAARGQIDEEARARGEKVFETQGCVECHRPPTYTTPAVYDVGLEDAHGRRKFNPPSLRGVSQRPTLFHDNRARSLEDVLIKHRHGEVYDASPEDLQALLTFLRSL